MKASSRRTATLLWTRLKKEPDSFGAALLATTGAAGHVSTSLKAPYSTGVLEEPQDDEQEDEVNVEMISPHRRLSYQHRPVAKQILKCTCGYQDQKDVDNDIHDPLPPPLPEPVYSVHRRVLPEILTALSAPQGRQYLQESLVDGMAESYWTLTEQFVNQSDPAYCGVTTLLMILNAMNVDPNSRWKGGWRFYGDEDVLLQGCCLNTERIRRVGITMEQFMILGTCHGLQITMKRPLVDSNRNGNNQSSTPYYSLEDFRSDIRHTLDSRASDEDSMLVVSFSRSALQQTGDGHFSPIAAYHEESDQVLILDVARFKYSPYWVSVDELYGAMEPVDEATQSPRGWYVMKPPSEQKTYYEMTSEDRRPAHLVPQSHEQEACPVGKIKVQFCPAKNITD